MCENGTEFNDIVDPRVHIELDRLNNATDEINKLEVDLDEARVSFRELLCESTARIEELRLKLGLCVERAKPYYEARFCANETLTHTQIAAMKYEKANSAHSAAREMVYLAEQGLGGRTLDPAWQEMLNHATQRVNEAETDRSKAGAAHRIACVKLEACNAQLQNLQKELKRSIAKSSLSIRRLLMTMNSITRRHELMLLPYYEMKAHFNNLLGQQKKKVQNLEDQVSNAKITYADALKNLEQISDEIHRRRRSSKATKSINVLPNKQINIESKDPFAVNLDEEYNSYSCNFTVLPTTTYTPFEEDRDHKNVCILPKLSSEGSGALEKQHLGHSQSSEWTEINLDISSPEEEIPYKKLGDTEDKPRLTRQKTMPNPVIENEYTTIKNKIKLDPNISNWINRSSAKIDSDKNTSRRQSLDNILGPTGEKVKEIFTHGMMMLNISSITDRRNSEPKPGINEKNKTAGKKLPSPLEKSFTYLNLEDDNSDTESLSSVDMLNEEQITSLMLDKEISAVCEHVLGTPISEVVALPTNSVDSSNVR